MLRLFLLRHAKSDWDAGVEDDHDRPLNPRGRDAARRMGAYMRAHGYMPDLVLCSTAMRTQETAALIKLSPPADLRDMRELYLAEASTLLETLRSIKDARSVMLIGHNPGIGMLASSLARTAHDSGEYERLERVRKKYPTGALSVFDFDVARWHDIGPGIGAVEDYMPPRELALTAGDANRSA